MSALPEPENTAPSYPIVFKIQVVVQGTDYSAGVEFRGGAVVTLEDDGYLAHGLKPGGVAGIGATLVEAYFDLKTNIELVLYELAAKALDYSEFRGSVSHFFRDTDSWAKEAFAEARTQVAAGRVACDLPVKANPAMRHRVVQFEEQLPKNNPEPHGLGLAGLGEEAA